MTLTLGGALVGNAIADSNGKFSTTVQVGNVDVGRHELIARCGPTLTTTVDVVVATKVDGGSSTSVIIVMFLLVAMGYLLLHFGLGRES